MNHLKKKIPPIYGNPHILQRGLRTSPGEMWAASGSCQIEMYGKNGSPMRLQLGINADSERSTGQIPKNGQIFEGKIDVYGEKTGDRTSFCLYHLIRQKISLDISLSQLILA